MDKPKYCEMCDQKGSFPCSVCESAWYCSKQHQKRHIHLHYMECLSYKKEHSQEAGNYLVASRNIKAGHEIMFEEPLAIGPLMTSYPVCLTCFKLLPPDFNRCPDCAWPICSKECFISRKHERECQILCRDVNECGVPNSFTETPRYDTILTLRCLLLKEQNPRKFNFLLTMASQHDILQEQQDPFHLTSVAYFSRVLDYPVDVVQHIRGAILSNAIEIRGPNGKLRAVYPNVNLFNHSCIPNVHLSCDNQQKMKARAAVTISKNDPLCISYSGTLTPTWERKEYLYSLHHFYCQCKRCRDPSELGTYFSSPRCPKCIQQFLVNVKPSLWSCQKCGLSCDSAEILEEIETWLLRMSMNELLGTGNLYKMRNGLSQVEFSFHRKHFIYLKASQEAISKLRNDFTYEAVKFKIDLWQNMLNLIDELEPGLTLRRGMMLMELGKLTEALIETGKDLTPNQVENYRRDARRYYSECKNILSLEPKDTPEYQMLSAISSKSFRD